RVWGSALPRVLRPRRRGSPLRDRGLLPARDLALEAWLSPRAPDPAPLRLVGGRGPGGRGRRAGRRGSGGPDGQRNEIALRDGALVIDEVDRFRGGLLGLAVGDAVGTTALADRLREAAA